MFRIALCLLLLSPAAARAEDAVAGPAEGLGECDVKPAPADADRGAWFYGQACLYCHGPVSVLRPRIQGQSVAEQTAWLDALLLNHHCSIDPQMRADVIAHLLGLQRP